MNNIADVYICTIDGECPWAGCPDPCDSCYASKKQPKGEYCEICGKFVEGFVYKMCCNAFDCGCQGKPVEPCICSEKCWEKGVKGE